MRAIYGYCRISTAKQCISRQIRNIMAIYPDAVIVQEVFTGTKVKERPEWMKLYTKVLPGDTIVFDSVSRMSRDADEGFRLYEDLYRKEVELVFLNEPHINTKTFRDAIAHGNIEMTGTKVDSILQGVNQYLMELAREQIKIAFDQSEKEVKDLQKRTKEGMQTAKLQGKHIGRPAGPARETQKGIRAKKQIQKYSKDFGGTLNDMEVMKLIGVSRNTYYKYKRELNSFVEVS